MAVPWLSVLKVVPWSDVISNAPIVADAAQTLWKVVSGKSAEPAQRETAASQAETAAEPRVAELEAEVAKLNGEMLETSKLLKALADQNANLIARVEAHRIRVLWLTGISAGALLVALVSLAVAIA